MSEEKQLSLRFYYYLIDIEMEQWLYVVAHTFKEANDLMNQWNKYRHKTIIYIGTSVNYKHIDFDEFGNAKLGKTANCNKTMKERLNEDFFKRQIDYVRKENEKFAARINHD